LKKHLALIAGCAVLLAGCSTPKIWPFYKKPKPAPEAVHELNLLNNDGTPANYPQYWKRNTLIIDLSGVSGAGGVAARLPEQTAWPVRVGVRVRPGSVEQIEVQGEERNVLAVRKDGVDPIDIEFAPSVFRKTTAAIYINWGFMPQFAEAVIESAPNEAADTARARTLPPNTVPGLNIVWNCGDCKRNDKVIPLMILAYRDAAAQRKLTVSDAVSVPVWIVDFRQRNPGIRSMFGIMAGKDRLGVKVRFGGQVFDVSDYEANAWLGMNHLCETVAKGTLDKITGR